ncbi:high-potential iron-sulfur protein [Labilithrix luteola]|uniref:High-potential iron-sulfur protein n=1 Tax=Labilithrix luteola TaxID=1391654 RepID=A0A0K1Q6W0_9BACT|nr:hypothetical protein [Labilithrix luteola]AKV01454.1 high-potential iron-sulfur protein [Labilithrix luteola]
MKDPIDRREAIRRLALFSTAALASQLLPACKSKPSCNDVSGLSADDVRARNDMAGYVEHAPDPAKKCSGCMHYLPGAPNACGGCKVVKGPIDAEAYCRLWAATPS